MRRADVARPRDVPDLVDDVAGGGAAAGRGIAGRPGSRADPEPDLVRVMPQRCNHFDVGLVAQADLYKAARVQAVIEAVVEEFATAAASR